MALCDVTSNSVLNLRFNDKSTNVMNSPSLTENYMNAPWRQLNLNPALPACRFSGYATRMRTQFSILLWLCKNLKGPRMFLKMGQFCLFKALLG